MIPILVPINLDVSVKFYPDGRIKITKASDATDVQLSKDEMLALVEAWNAENLTPNDGDIACLADLSPNDGRLIEEVEGASDGRWIFPRGSYEAKAS